MACAGCGRKFMPKVFATQPSPLNGTKPQSPPVSGIPQTVRGVVIKQPLKPSESQIVNPPSTGEEKK